MCCAHLELGTVLDFSQVVLVDRRELRCVASWAKSADTLPVIGGVLKPQVSTARYPWAGAGAEVGAVAGALALALLWVSTGPSWVAAHPPISPATPTRPHIQRIPALTRIPKPRQSKARRRISVRSLVFRFAIHILCETRDPTERRVLPRRRRAIIYAPALCVVSLA